MMKMRGIKRILELRMMEKKESLLKEIKRLKKMERRKRRKNLNKKVTLMMITKKWKLKIN